MAEVKVDHPILDVGSKIRLTPMQFVVYCDTEGIVENGKSNYIAIPNCRGFVYASANQLYSRVKTEGDVKYLKCNSLGCDASAKFYEHVCANAEIRRLTLLHRCRKRAVDDDEPLREIFNEEVM